MGQIELGRGIGFVANGSANDGSQHQVPRDESVPSVYHEYDIDDSVANRNNYGLAPPEGVLPSSTSNQIVKEVIVEIPEIVYQEEIVHKEKVYEKVVPKYVKVKRVQEKIV